MMRDILVPLDGSPESERILPFARRLGGSIRVVHAGSGLGPYLGRLGFPYEQRTGQPWEAILAAPAPDLIAMTTHGRRGIQRMMLGSVTENVLRHATVPMLVCRPDVEVRPWKKVVVPLDGSQAAERILPEAVDVARASGATIDAVAVSLPAVHAGGIGDFPMYYEPEDPMPYLKSLCERVSRDGVPVRPVVRTGRAVSEILHHVAEVGAGLICMMTHGRTGLSRLLAGSVAEEILRLSPVPVLVRRKVAIHGVPAVEAEGAPAARPPGR